MQFFAYRTSYENYKEALIKANRKNEVLPILDYYKYVVRRSFQLAKYDDNIRSVYNQALTEEEWIKFGKPYYNFHKNLTGTFSKTKLNFPAKYLQFPYTTLTINFAKDDQNLMFDNNRRQIQSVIVLTTDQLIDLEKNKEIKNENRLIFWMDYGGEDFERQIKTEDDLLDKAEQRSVYAYRQLRWIGDETVEEAIVKETHPNFYRGVQIPSEIEAKVLRLVCSIAFLTKEENPIIVPHVLNEDIQKFKNADKNRQKELHDKATRRRKSVGYLVGADQMFDVGHIGSPQSIEKGEKTGRELKFAHIVSGFWKLVRYGKNLEQGKVQWIMPYVRGEGKPFKGEEN